MSAETPSPTLKTQKDFSSTFANEPLANLLKKPLHMMAPEEALAYAMELRNLRTSPQALGKRLRAERVKDEDGDEETGPQVKGTGQGKVKESFDDFMKGL